MDEGGVPKKGPPPPPPNLAKWMTLVELVQFIWDHGTIPKDMGWKILLLITKGNSDTRGIELLEVLWKVMETIIDTRIKKAGTFHDILQGFHTGRANYKIHHGAKYSTRVGKH